MSIILLIWYMLNTPSSDVEALRRTAPSYLTTETARVHLASARLASDVNNLDPSVVLAIAYRESRYTLGTRGAVVRGKHACGLMQPHMSTKPCERQTVLEGYFEGAEHLRAWLDSKACRGDTRCALLGYSGGYPLLNGCAAGPVVVVRGGRTADLCQLIPGATQARARAIGIGTRRPIGKPST